MKFCAILGVLMWKHLIVRKRAFINTAFELVSTFLFIILMLPIRDVDLNKHRYDQEMSSMNIKSPDRIYYTPNNTIYNVLMTKVGTKFDLERVRKMPCLIDEKGIYGFHPDDPEMVAREEKMPLGDVVVKFSLWKTISNESVRDDFPTILVYTVRNANFSQKIRAIGLNDKAILPQLTEEVMFKTDLVQWAIDSAFLEHHEEHKTNSTVRTLKLHIPTSKQPNYSSMVNAGATIFVIIFSVIQPFVGTVTRIIDDSGLQALISISGVSPNIIQLSHVLNSMIVGVFYASLATYLFRSQSEAGNVLIRANTLQLWIYLMLHFLSIVVVAMALSYLLTSSNHVTIISLMIYIVFSAIAIILPFQIKGNWKILFGLLPHVSLFWFFFNSAMQFTFTGKEEIDWSQEYPNVPSMITIWIQILVQIGLWVILAWYLHKVKPGQYGVAYPWNFCCTKMFWSPEAPVVPAELESNREEKMKNIKYFEPKGAIDKLVGIKILGVTKIFYNNGIAFKALDDVSVDIYNGEITMLLGHNGAGKTTLISIITGMYSPTEGQIIIDGQDALAIRSSGQSKIGYCPQHNMFISKLNVLEHVMFFSMIKGVPCKVVKAKSMEILKEVGIADKWNKLPGALSGGMARRLQLTTAMAGDSNVLILDEPTSGLDVETRRSLWDTFLALREGRTLILSTHFPEEADALGDRTIALKHGVIQCSATNMFLKKAIGGGGYQVRVGTENREKIFEMIKSYCPNSTCIHKTDGILVNVPPDQIPHLPKLFEHMESNQASLGYTRIGVGATTLEDVFMKMCSDFDVEELETEVDTAMSHELENRVTGFTLFKRHLKTRIMRDRMLRNIKVNPILNRMCLFLVPFLFTLMMGLISSKENPQKHSIELSKLSNNEIVPYYGHYKDTSSKTKLNEDVIRMFKAPLNMLSAKLESGTFVDVDHSLLKLGKDKVLIPRTRKDAVTKATAQIFLIMTCCAFAIILPCEENDSGARHFHFMLGINPALHWIVMLLFHLCIFILFVVLPVLILMAIFDKYETFTRLHYFLAVIILFMFGGSAMFLLQYMISLMLSTKAASAVYQVITVFATIVSFNCINLKLDSAKLADYLAIAQFFFYITPFPHIMNGMASVIENARLNAYCSINRQLCPKFIVDAEFEVSECCASKGDMISNYEYVFEGAPHSLLALAILTLMYAAIMGLYHTLYIQRYVEFLKFLVLSKEKEKLFDDQMVLQEEKYVMEAVENLKTSEQISNEDVSESKDSSHIEDSLELDGHESSHSSHSSEEETERGTENQTHDILLINDVHKTYVSILSNYTYAVRGISLSVHKGECYGLLGVNGAGKSTTFKMLTGLTVPTRGDIYLDSYSISKHRKKYLQHISYCPQYDGLDMFLTLKENLRLVMDIKGFSNKDIKRELDAWILIVGLHNIANRPVGTYSGGGARRAVTACALASRCDLVTLDEPTAGVDVAARRKLWRAMQRAKASGASIMITSHSMDEMEVLCDRLCIMSKGQLRTLGTPDAVKAAHAYGYSYKIKIHDKNVSNDEEFKKLTEALQKTVMEQFKNKVSLKDKHKTMLNYHIQENIPYSQLFHMLANIKKSSVIVEDYSVSETTLEEVFIAFAREAKEMDRKNAKPKENGKEKEKEEKEKSENTEDDDDDEEEESKKKT